MKEIYLSRGKVAIVDDDMYDYLNQWKWSCDSHGYAARHISETIDTKRPTFRMHHAVLPPPTGMFIDHINHNPSDNRRSNLRICTRSQNNANRVLIQKNNTSGAKGVCHKINTDKWEACIGYQGKSIYIGLFDDINDAVNARNNKARELFGEFAYINVEDI